MTRSLALTFLPHRTSIAWNQGRISFIDQRSLPHRGVVIETDDWRVVARAIQSLAIRGAPLIGVAAALGIAVAAVKPAHGNLITRIETALAGLVTARPTAANLFWALNRMHGVLDGSTDSESLVASLVGEALEIQEDDRRRCESIGSLGAELIADGARVLTICNTGYLATAGIGTALGAVYKAVDAGKAVHVFACETRPLLQGARLTVWELTQAHIPVSLLVDSAAAGLIASGGVDLCIIGADRIAANGDTVNKVGSYQLALACKRHQVPFYVAAPRSTVDAKCSDGRSIPIEQRNPIEVGQIDGKTLTVKGVSILNPAFDLVPADLIAGIVTEDGIYSPASLFRKGIGAEEL